METQKEARDRERNTEETTETKAQSELEKEELDLAYNHLSKPARELLARMSFFPGGLFGGFDDLLELLGDNWADAAEEIAGQNLVEYDKSTDRYVMSQPVLEYAREKLDEGEGDDFRRQATDFWAEFAQWYDLMLDVRPAVQEAEAQLPELPDDPEERHSSLESLRSNSLVMMIMEEDNVVHAAEWAIGAQCLQRTMESLRSNSLVMMIMEEDNVVHAAEWAIGARDESGLGLVDSLEDYLELREQWDTKERLYRLALSRRRQLAAAEPGEYMPDVAGTLNNMGELLSKTEKFSNAKQCFQEALRIYRSLSQSQPDIYMPKMARTFGNMGALQSGTGHSDEALAYYKEALEIYREFFQQYPSAYSQELLDTLKDATEVYKKLGLVKRVKECQDEIEQLLS